MVTNLTIYIQNILCLLYYGNVPPHPPLFSLSVSGLVSQGRNLKDLIKLQKDHTLVSFVSKEVIYICYILSFSTIVILVEEYLMLFIISLFDI